MTELIPPTLAEAENAAPTKTSLSVEKNSLLQFIELQETFKGDAAEWKKSDAKYSTNPPRPSNSPYKIDALTDDEAAELLQLFHVRKQLHEQKSRMSGAQSLRFNILANKIAYHEKKPKEKNPPSKTGGIEKKKKEKKRKGRAPKKFELDDEFQIHVVDSKGVTKLVIQQKAPVKSESETE